MDIEERLDKRNFPYGSYPVMEEAKAVIQRLRADCQRLRAEIIEWQSSAHRDAEEIERLKAQFGYCGGNPPCQRLEEVRADNLCLRNQRDEAFSQMGELRARNAELLAAVKIARTWMPNPPTGAFSKDDLTRVDAAIVKAEGK